MQATQQVSGDSQLCTVCQSFWGNPKFNGLCSGCYKMTANQDPVQIKSTIQEEKTDQKEEVVVDVHYQKQHSQNTQQATRCKQCNKKLGIYGYQCKCHYSFCAKHRVPEDHSCTFDHASLAKKQLVQQNPLVGPSKIEKI